MIFDFRKTHSNTKGNYTERYKNKVIFTLVCLENGFIGYCHTTKSCLIIRLSKARTINQYTSNMSDDYELSEDRLMPCVETLRVAPKF